MTRSEGVGKDNGVVHPMPWVPGVVGKVHALGLGRVKSESNGLEVLLQAGVGPLKNTYVLADRLARSGEEVIIYIRSQVNLVDCG